MNRLNISTRILSFLPILLITMAVMISCKTMQPAIDSKDLSYLYNPSRNPINPNYKVFNQTDESSLLSIKFFTGDLFFSEANPQGVPMAMILVTVKLYNITSGRILADTAVYNINIVKEESRPEYIYNIPLRVETGVNYMAEVKILDRLRMQVIQAFIPFNTLSYNNKYNFKAQGHFMKNELFNPVLRENEYVNLIYPRNPVDSIYVSFYKPLTGIPDPPSMLLPEKILDYEPDTVIVFPYSDTLPMMFPQKGVYLCTTDRDIKDGLTFYNFGMTYPSMTTPEVMIEPLAYLTSQDEIASLTASPKPKVALDEFWIKCGGNIEKSRELIRIFYTRVYYSNFYFTSFKEGWRTERGMIYIIYGPPDKVYKTSDGERWGYRKPVIKSSWGGRYRLKEDYLYFTFRKRNSIFSDNDYYISRSETLITNWDQAIASWRRGIVYRLDNPGDI